MRASRLGSRSSALELARAAYRDISLYAPDRSPCRIDLSDNTNLFGVPPAALSVLRGSSEQRITRYPSLYAPHLKEAIAGYLGVDANCVVTGCGSDDVLDSAIRAFCEPGDVVATSDPSFAMIPLFARMNGLQIRSVELTGEFDVDAGALVAAEGKVTYLCSPNNPTGNIASRSAIRRVIDNAAGIVLIDEAYAEFAPESFVRDVPSMQRTLVVRTLSKAFGLAGLRIGYAVGAPELVEEVEKSRGPYKVNALAEEAAIAALTVDRAWVRDTADEAIAVREKLGHELRALGLTPLASHANFLLVPVSDAIGIAARLRGQGVAVRPFSGLAGIGDALRISVGPWPVVAEALAALEGVLG